MKRFDIDLGVWVIGHFENEERAFEYGSALIDQIRAIYPMFDGEVCGVTEIEED